MLPLICIDVDGTLLGSSGVPTDGVWTAAEAAIARGQHLAICTARVAVGPTWDYARRLDPAGWHIFHSGAALATVVGVLIEVPVMLLVVKIVNRSKGWYEQGLPRS